MSQQTVTPNRPAESGIVYQWARRFVRSHWRTTMWGVLWITAAVYTTDGILAPLLLIGLLALTVSDSPDYTDESDGGAT